MWFRSLFDGLKGMSSRHRPARQRPVSRRLALEALEDRAVPASLSVGDVTLLEGNDGTRYASVPVTLSAPSAQTVTVNYRTADGTARAGSDYDALSGTLTFAPGQTSKSVPVPVRGDLFVEPDEKFSVKLSAAKNAKIADGTGVVTIADDGDGTPRPEITVYDFGGIEGTSDSPTLFTVAVTLSAASAEPITVNFATSDPLGDQGAISTGYVATSGTLTFAPGETFKTITIEVIADAYPEQTQWFYVNLFGASANAVIVDGQGVGEIADDDGWQPYFGGSDGVDVWPGFSL
jgi:hypothetical protein